MGKTKTYLELNGKRYDVATGKIINNVATNRPASALITKKAAVKKEQSVEGIISKKTTAQGKTASPSRQPSNLSKSAHHKKTQHTKTLMRHAVIKPSRGGLFHAKALPLSSSPLSVNTDVAMWPAVSQQRIHRAEAIHKSRLISRFAPANLLIKTAVLPVKKEPSVSDTLKQRPVTKRSEQAISKALSTAHSHEQPKLKKTRAHHKVAHKLHISPKKFNIGAVVLATLLLGSFVFYQNMANLNVRIAAARAGFNASLPAYHPAGFALKGPVQYAPGELTINYKSNSDSRNFQVKQQPSNWDSETLRSAYVAKTNQSYQVYQANGRTVYIDKTNANMVTGDKWVQVNSDGSLSTEQLLNIVKSVD